MAVYNPANIKALWLNAGGDPSRADIAVAVALAESGGKTDAQHVNTNGTIDRGIWQINSVHGAQSTFDPANNASAAVSISKNGTDWTPWTTFNSGAYKQFLGKSGGTSIGDIGSAVGGAASGAAKTATGVVGGATDALSALGGIAKALLSPDTYFRLGKGLLGGVLLILGTGALVFVVANHASGGGVVKAAKDAAVVAAA